MSPPYLPILRNAETREVLRRLRRLPVPASYFSETRTSPALWPDRILCFCRKTWGAETLIRHHHHRHVLVVPWEGKGEVHVDERRFSLGPGNGLLILPFQFHYRFQAREKQVLWQFVTFELPVPSPLEVMNLHPLRKINPSEQALLAAFLCAWDQPDVADGELAPWLSLFLHRLREAPLPPGHAKEGEQITPSDGLLTRINQKCMPRLHEMVGIKALAKRLSISESHLRARFREETGTSLGQHIRRLRLQKAMGLLVQSELSITQVAERCGFETIFAFSRSFRRDCGMSAREYRRRFLRA
jgi:AraC-like DNA-binding protein